MPRKFLRPSHRSRPNLIGLVLLIVLFSILMGIGLAQAIEPGGPDEVPDRFQLGQQIYLENCASCHIGVPPEVMPTQTWQTLIQDPQHYGASITPLRDPNRRILWNYLRTYSRPTNDDEQTPYRIADSRYFRALHPKVPLPRRPSLSGCITCHPGANQFKFRKLSPEMEKSP
jgi:Dihaem cytochrome c